MARTPQADNLRSQLAKLGNTPFEVAGHLSEEASGIRLNLSANWFIPASVVADWRRQVIDKLIEARRVTYRRELAVLETDQPCFPSYFADLSGQCDEQCCPEFLP